MENKFLLLEAAIKKFTTSSDLMSNSKVSLKLLIDKARNKVLFAEADKDFVDFLFNIMSMPIGTVTRLLKKKSMVGSLGNLYGSIEKLNDKYLQTEETKEYLLKPKIPYSASPLLLRDDDAEVVSKKLYQCNSRYNLVTDDPRMPCPSCGKVMRMDFKYVTLVAGAASYTATPEGGGFVREPATFMVTGDLVVTPCATISGIAKVIDQIGVQGLEEIEETVVYLGMDQGLMLLKESLQSDTVLTNVFLKPHLFGRSLLSTGIPKKRKPWILKNDMEFSN